ncbi:MAG: aminotransferase class V-fold PLP-dependent enzyme [Planctomycetaceae bacterium]
MTRLIDLDANATTRPLPEVIETVARCLNDSPGNPGSRHGLGRKARQVLEASRESIAAILGADPEELIFTSGGTEANNLAIAGLARGSSRTLLLSPGEHPSNLEACRHLVQKNWSLRYFPVDSSGRIRVDDLSVQDWSHAGLATAILAHNETGVVQNVEPIAASCRQHGVPLHLDGVQAVGKIPVTFHDLDATSLSFGAHKFHGPRGIGGLLLRRGVTLTPLQHGGHQEGGRRPGTEPVALIAGLAKACSSLRSARHHFSALRIAERRHMGDRLPPANIRQERPRGYEYAESRLSRRRWRSACWVHSIWTVSAVRHRKHLCQRFHGTGPSASGDGNFSDVAKGFSFAFSLQHQ